MNSAQPTQMVYFRHYGAKGNSRYRYNDLLYAVFNNESEAKYNNQIMKHRVVSLFAARIGWKWSYIDMVYRLAKQVILFVWFTDGTVYIFNSSYTSYKKGF